MSCFDGIGTPALILKELTAGLALHIVWEIDSDCLQVLGHHHPSAQLRGDFLKDDPQQVADVIKQFDPSGSFIILFVRAPPCPDFSCIVEDAPAARGQEGQKFTAFCAFCNKIEMAIPHLRVGYLTENVIMKKEEADHFSARLDCQAVICDSSDLGLTNRPRLWWTRIPWSKLRNSPVTGRPLRWSKRDKHHRLHQDGPLQEAHELDLGDQQLCQSVVEHKARVPCFTTPAPQEGGRPAPKRLRGRMSPQERARWISDDRTFAPWQYADEALTRGPDGSYSVPTAEVKEQLHQLPMTYTKIGTVNERSRHRLIANGWHVGTAKFMFMLVLQAVLLLPRAAIPPSPQRSALQIMVGYLEPFPPALGPGNWPLQPASTPKMSDHWDHWRMAIDTPHPLMQPPRLEPGWQQCLDLQVLIGGSLSRLRCEVVQEVQQMIGDATADTMQWWQSLPPHVAQVYYDKDNDQIAQIPILLQLLQLVGMPDLAILEKDLTQGFAMLGTLNSGSGWLPRTDGRYDHPIDTAAFKRHNKNYTMTKLRSQRVDPEWQTMLTEPIKELDKGRMSGPYKAPSWWPFPSRSLPGRELLSLPCEEACFAFSFSVRQTDKVRRCEDFRRSGHNGTILAKDVPYHHDIASFVNLARAQATMTDLSSIWAQDLAGAYRQFPVREPNDCFCVLMTPDGALILRHHAMMFGAASSVWNFNRAADSLMFLCRRLLAVSVGHYVDDFIGIEPGHLVVSGFEQFTALTRALGLRMKEAKALAPQPKQKVLGILMEIEPSQIVLRPHPDRCAKMMASLQRILRANHLTNEEAQHIAGKMNFLASTMFGQLGRAALQPLYARAHGLALDDKGYQLNHPLRAALRTLHSLLSDVQPRQIPRNVHRKTAVLYTDAYFVMNGVKHQIGSNNIPSKWQPKRCPNFENGWGYVLHFDHRTYFAAGRLPPFLIQRFCTRKAYIYFLEIAAQLIGFLALKSFDVILVTSYIDNTSGLFALQKGYCKDPAICNMVAVCWRFIAKMGWHLNLEWVASADNMSDAVSRHKFYDMISLQAEEHSLCLQGLFTILYRVATDETYAHTTAVDDLLQLQLHNTSPPRTVKVDLESQCG